MRPVRSFEAERAFEEAWGRRGEAEALLEVAHRAARRGQAAELEICLAKLYLLSPRRAQAVADELYALLESVRNHPSFQGPKASAG